MTNADGARDPSSRRVGQDPKCGGPAATRRGRDGPLDASEGILYADCDIEQMVRQKMSTDYAGHYNRPDIFELRVNTSGPQLLRNWSPSVEEDD